jgi:aspartate racemase
VDFLSQVYKHTTASKDWQFPRVLVDANSKIPSRGRYFDLNETDPSPYIAATIDELIAAGASVVVVPCNTAHILFDRWCSPERTEVESIIDATLAELSKDDPDRVAVLGSVHLVRHRTYLEPLENSGFLCHDVTDDEQRLINMIISEIKISNTLQETTSVGFRLILENLEDLGTKTIILGCTELAQALRCVTDHRFTGQIIDSNAALAKAALLRLVQAG